MTKLAAQCYTIREYMQNADDILQSFKRLAADGWKAVQLSGNARFNPSFLKAMAGDCGLQIVATHTPTDLIFNDIDSVIAEHKAMDCRYVGIGAMPREYERSANGFLDFARALEAPAKALADHNLTLIYHNHNFEFQRFGEVTGLDILMSEAPSELMFELDTYWVQAGGGDVRSWIKKCAGRLDVIHFKDMAYCPEQNGPFYTEIGHGNMNWKKIISACAKAAVKYHIVEQDTCPADPFVSLKDSLDYLTGMGLR